MFTLKTYLLRIFLTKQSTYFPHPERRWTKSGSQPALFGGFPPGPSNATLPE